MRSNTVKVISDTETIAKHFNELSAFGARALIVTGQRSSAVNGSLGDVVSALEKLAIKSTIYDEVEENPSVATVCEAAVKAVEFNADFIIAIGGGSPMDAGKAVAFLAKNKEYIYNDVRQTEEFLFGDTHDTLSSLPLVCIPTTCGTGSEVTGVSVLTSHTMHTKISVKKRIYPDLALIDTKYLHTMSVNQIRQTAVDALAHLTESYLSTASDDFSELYAEKGLKIWGSVKSILADEQALSRITDKDYHRLMLASLYAGYAISFTGTSLPHALSYTLTYRRKIPHGAAAGIFLPGFIKYYENRQRADYLLELLGFSSADEFADYIRTLLQYPDINSKVHEEAIKRVLENQSKLKSYPFNADENLLENYFTFYYNNN